MSETPVPSAPRVRSTSRLRLAIAVAVVVTAIGVLLFQGLGGATMYFRTADEAIAQRETLGEKRFRIEGTVVPGSLRVDGAFTDFAVESKGTTVQIDNNAATQGIFREGIPVVLEGRFKRGENVFASDRIMVKHDENYKAEYPERVSTTVVP